MDEQRKKSFLPAGALDRAAFVLIFVFALYFCYRQILLPNSPPRAVVVPLLGERPHPGHPSVHFNDFKHIWLGAVVLGAGGNPYLRAELEGECRKTLGEVGINPYVYPPFNGLVLQPLTWGKDFLAAGRTWTLLQYIMLIGALVLIFRTVEFRRPYVALAAALLLLATSFPLTRTLTAGQLNVALLLVYALAAFLLKTGRLRQAGFWIAFGAWFKVAPGILFIYFVLRRRWRAALWTAGCATGILILTLLWVGPKTHLAYLPLVRDMGYGKSTWDMDYHIDPFNQSLNALFHHVLAPRPMDKSAPRGAPMLKNTPHWLEKKNGAARANGLTYAAALLLLAGVSGLTLRGIRREHDAPTELLLFSLWVFLALLLPSLFWDHYLIILLFPQLILLGEIMRRSPGGADFWIPLAVWVAAAMLINWWFFFAHPKYHEGPAVLLLSHKLLGALLLLGLNVWFVFGAKDGAPISAKEPLADEAHGGD